MSNRPTKQQAIALNRERDPRLKRRRLGDIELAVRHGCLTEAARQNFRSRYDAGQIDSQGGAIALLLMRCLIAFVAELVQGAQPQGGDGEGQRQEAGDGDGDDISEREEVIACLCSKPKAKLTIFS